MGFYQHAVRRTIATWLQTASHSEWGDWAGPQSLGLSCDSGSRYPLELKRKLLEKWADHVEGLVTPAGVRRVG